MKGTIRELSYNKSDSSDCNNQNRDPKVKKINRFGGCLDRGHRIVKFFANLFRRRYHLLTAIGLHLLKVLEKIEAYKYTYRTVPPLIILTNFLQTSYEMSSNDQLFASILLASGLLMSAEHRAQLVGISKGVSSSEMPITITSVLPSTPVTASTASTVSTASTALVAPPAPKKIKP